jgi:diguanylate cyclase (GGDEF)-like protein
VLTGSCERGRAIPFGPIEGVLEAVVARHGSLPPQQREELRRAVERAGAEYAGFLARLSPPLARLTGVEPQGAELPSEQGEGGLESFHQAVAEFLGELATLVGGLLVCTDDVQWADDASLRVLRRLAAHARSKPLLLVATVRPEELEGPAQIASEDLGLPATTVELAPLDEDASERLVAAYLGTRDVDAELVRWLRLRTSGSPLLLLEYVRAMLEAGLLSPRYEGWQVQLHELEDLELSDDALEFLAQRISRLEEEATAVLRTAAILGPRFDPELLAQVANVDQERLSWALAEGIQARLIVRASAGRYEFVHGRIREALVGQLESWEQCAFHARAAEALDHQSPRAVYDIARHYSLAGPDANAGRAYETNIEAGCLALGDYAYEEAYRFLIRAKEVLPHTARPTEVDLLEPLGEACMRTGRHAEARGHLAQSIELTKKSRRRVRLRTMLAQVHVWDNFHTSRAWEQVDRSLDELGHPFPRTGVGLLLSSLFLWVASLIVARFGWGYGTASGTKREEFRLVARLYKLAGHVAYWQLQPIKSILIVFRSMYAVHRLGLSRELVQMYTGYALIMSAVGKTRVSARYGRRAVELAEKLQDPSLVAYSSMNECLAQHVRGEPLEGGSNMQDCMTRFGRWLDTGEFVQGIADLSWNLQLRGYAREALGWVEYGMERERGPQGGTGTIFLPTRATACLAMLGQDGRAQSELETAQQIAAAAPEDHYRAGNLLSHQLFYYYETGQLDAAQYVIDRYRRLRLNPKFAPFHMRNYYVFQAYTALSKAAEAPKRENVRQQLRRALTELKMAARTGHPLLVGHLMLLRAAMHRLEGSSERAWNTLPTAEDYGYRYDNPWLLYEVAKERALMFEASGHEWAAQRCGSEAQDIAVKHGWHRRVKEIRSHFGLTSVEFGSTGTKAPTATRTQAGSVDLRRHHDALLAVSRVSLSVVEPDQQAKAVLQELQRVMGAERAFLFLFDEQGQDLHIAAGVGEAEPETASDYSSRVLAEVRHRREPVVVTGADDARELGSESAVAFNLRSVVAAPLVLRDRLMGVVYLDNRLARGVFTEEDLDVLVAMCGHIAIAIEGARTRQLEVQVQTEREKRRLAERVRVLTNRMVTPRDSAEIVDLALRNIAEFMHYDGAACHLWWDGQWTVVAQRGGASDGLAEMDPEGDPWLREVIGERVVRTRPLGPEEERRGECLYVPLVWDGVTTGLFLFEMDDASGYDQTAKEVALTFAGQAAVALHNVRLFSEVQRLAAIDELTNTYNRRSLFEKAEQEFERARRYERSLSLCIIDLDHFKEINDTYGHKVGDAVLAEVGDRIHRNVRDVDIVGRYGGEEFVIVAPETTLDDALEHVGPRLRSGIGRASVDTGAGPIEITVSIGVASLSADDSSLDALLERADAALYQAKRAGRNRVEAAPTGEHATGA